MHVKTGWDHEKTDGGKILGYPHDNAYVWQPIKQGWKGGLIHLKKSWINPDGWNGFFQKNFLKKSGFFQIFQIFFCKNDQTSKEDIF